MLERHYQRGLIKRIKELLPGCFVLKNDPNYIQGIPDLTILYRDRWALLEVKRSEAEYLKDQQPNQDWYVNRLNEMSFSAFIFPENEREVLDALQQALQT